MTAGPEDRRRRRHVARCAWGADLYARAEERIFAAALEAGLEARIKRVALRRGPYLATHSRFTSAGLENIPRKREL